MNNKKNKFYEIIESSIFKYFVYLITICLLAHLNEDIKKIFVYLVYEHFYFLMACVLLLLLLIDVPYARTKYKKYINKILKKHILFSIYIILSFIIIKEKVIFAQISFIVVIFIIPIIEIIKSSINKNKNRDKLDNQKIIIDSDKPITKRVQDFLDRYPFIESLKNILLKNQKFSTNEGFVLILSASWGEGKTSCLNLLKEELAEERERNPFYFIDINPWFNDTTEKLLNAIFGEINHFAKTNSPHISLENQFDEIVKLSNLKLGSIELQLDKFTENKNIQNKIKEIGDILRQYKKRIIITIDDIDRLDKNHILYILQTVQMFKQYTNIIFILSYNSAKVEEILCESSDSCFTDKTIYKNLYYKNYLEKIASVIIALPKIEDINIHNILFEKINDILEEEQMPKINRGDFDFYIATSRFKTIRDIKRFCNTFFISYAQVKNEVNVFNYINITTLFVFYPELYNEAWKNQYKWFKVEDKQNDAEQIKLIKQYFKNITERYNEEDIENINELITLISPTYEKIPAKAGKHYLKMANKGAKSYFVDDRYLQYYFTHNFSKNRIPDKILDENLQYFFNEKDEKTREKNILDFMNEYSSKISDIFRYLNIYCDDKYYNLIKQIILIFAKNSFELTQNFSEITEYICKIISKLKKDKIIEINNFLIEIINISSSISFSIEIYETLNSYNESLLNNDINKLLDDKISNDIEKALECFKYEQYTKYIYTWIRKYYVIRVSEIVDIINLKPEDYILIKQKVKKALHYIKGNIEYFMIFIGKNLEQTIKNYRDDNTFEHHYFSNFIYLIDIWGNDTILDMLSNFLNNGNGLNYDKRIDKLNELYRITLSDKKIKQLVKEHERIFLHKIVIYDLIKDINVKNFVVEKENKDFDFSYTYNDIKYLVEIKYGNNFNFNGIIKQLINYIDKQKQQVAFLYLVVDTEEKKLKMKKDLDVLVSKIDYKDKFIFRIEIKKNLLEKY
ncbi:P-loop NTPase fold protein [Candidatus Ruminimicrobium bovinum]|uniref:P-loop NTPase fold protein n=1 Tax=Candidatus Ruminimicrobium bovinum TaxID=3242779 RepID=UPI0039B86DB2